MQVRAFERYIPLIERTFNREGSLYWLVIKIVPFLLLNNLNNKNCGHVRKCVVLSIIFWTKCL